MTGMGSEAIFGYVDGPSGAALRSPPILIGRNKVRTTVNAVEIEVVGLGR